MITAITIGLTIIIICSFFALLESTVSFTDELKLEYLLQKNKDKITERKKEVIKKIIFKKDKYVSSLAIMSTFSNIMGSVILGIVLNKTFEHDYVFYFMIGYAYFMLVFSKIIPKIFSLSNFDFIMRKFAYFINIVYYSTLPFLFLVTFWLRIFKPKQQKISIKELKTIVNYYTQKGAIHSMEESMIDKLLSIKKKTIKDIIKNKEPILKLDYKRKLKKYRMDIIKSKNKIYAVQNNNEVVGIAFYRDIADLLLNDEEKTNNSLKVSSCLKSSFFIKDTDDIFDAILSFKKNKDRYAIVLNSDNDVVGIVTAKQVYTYAIN